MISTGKPLGTVLDALTREIETLSPEMKCSMLLLDGDGIHMRHASAPSLPQEFCRMIDGQPIGPTAGSCGTAMFRGETVISTEIASDPLWLDYRELALSHGLRACWAVPILSPGGKVLGSFGAYFGHAHAPEEKQLALLEIGRHIGGIAIERDRANRALHSRSEQLQMVMDAMPFSIAYADRNFRYVVVNRRFEELFRRPRSEIIGMHTWEVIGKELFEQIKPHMDRVMRGEVVTYERSRVDENGNVHHLEVLYLPQVGEGGIVLGHFGIVRDITDRKRDEAMLQFLANHDQLTKLPNRNQFAQRLADAIARAARYKHRVGVLFIDLDRFKNVNDTLGHESGDTLLIAVAERFREALRETDTVARLGGDEFTVVLEEIGDAGEIAATAQRLLETLGAPFDVQGQEVFASASIGISIYPDDGADAASLLRNADMAMYRAKEMGKNTFQFFTREATIASVARLQLENSLRRAIERGEFILHYQPMMDLTSLQIVGMEALVRWMHPDLGMVPPAQFIPLAEETGLIVQIGNWVLEQACRRTRALNQAGNLNLTVSVNLSARQFRRRDLAQSVAAVLAATGLPPSQLELEVTESSVMDDQEAAVLTLSALKAMGVHFSVDDFGTGYSSLSQLKRFPIDSLKIDQSFVRDIPADQDDAAIVSAIVAMGHRLRLKLIAEGVETPEQLAFLKALGCDLVQGYLFGKPMPEDEFVAFLARESPRHPL
jgi:diguanylate cyclase (GGDEF)-like protein/PAS domain S-box-containing protein